ncbi:MAG: hypothetical protein LBR61_09890 [Synergistaceae bacterium]|nr:hypothetical protein [Synergistaceae bacterium]
MAELIETSPKAVLELAREIGRGMKEVRRLNDELTASVKALGTTFQDEGYLVIRDYVMQTQKKIQDVESGDGSGLNFKTVMKKLVEYAELLENAVKATR